MWFKNVYVLRKTLWIPSLVWEVSGDCWKVGGGCVRDFGRAPGGSASTRFSQPKVRFHNRMTDSGRARVRPPQCFEIFSRDFAKVSCYMYRYIPMIHRYEDLLLCLCGWSNAVTAILFCIWVLNKNID